MEGLVKDSCWNNIVVDDIEVLERVSSGDYEMKGAFRGANEPWLLI